MLPIVRYSIFGTIFFSFLLLTITEAEAQRRVSYQQLSAQNRAPGLYVDHNVLPAENGEENVWFNFRFGYDVLNFRQRSGSSDRFEANASISIQIYKLEAETDLERLREQNSIRTLSWSGTAQADSFEATRSATRFLNGNNSLNLPPGRYAYSPRITVDGLNIPLRRNLRSFIVPDFNSSENLPVYFIEKTEDENAESIPLINYGRSVLYAEDFRAMFILSDPEKEYSVVVSQLNITNRDTSITDTVFEASLRPENLRNVASLRIAEGNQNKPFVRVLSGGDELTLAFIDIPNRKFQNSHFRIQLKQDDKIVASRNFRSLWIDIPTSLLNVDVAISMMEIILDSQQFRELRRGNEQERIQRFRNFWKERDPEPETDYNPLMVEFFKRVDIAFDRFTSPNLPGYETEQGRIYIRHGEPENVTRRLPSGRPAVEVWTYEGREFVFEATSGFGEYRLVSQSSR